MTTCMAMNQSNAEFAVQLNLNKARTMPIAAKKALKLACRKCGWTIVSMPHGDVFLYPGACGNCGGGDLALSVADKPNEPLANLKTLLRNILKFF